jgi:hypothetical protein
MTARMRANVVSPDQLLGGMPVWTHRDSKAVQGIVCGKRTKTHALLVAAIRIAQRLLAQNGPLKMPPRMPTSNRPAAPIWPGSSLPAGGDRTSFEHFDIATPGRLDDDGVMGADRGFRCVLVAGDAEEAAQGARASASVRALKRLERVRAEAPQLGRKHWSDMLRRLHTKVLAQVTKDLKEQD